MSDATTAGPVSEPPFTRARKGAVQFFVLGPIVGLLAMTLGGMITAGDINGFALVLFFPMAYAFGGGPAALTGITVGLLQPRLQGRRGGYVTAGVLGALWTGILPALIGSPDVSNAPAIAGMAAAGGLAGGVCGWRFLRPTPVVREDDGDSSFGACP